MLEVFTNTSQTLAQGNAIKFDTTKFSDCRMSLNSANTSITIRTPGRYLVSFDGIGGSGTASTAFTIQMYVNGVAQPCAQTTNTVAAGNDKAPLGFTTLIQVNNSCCSVNNSQVLTFVASETVSGTIIHANVSIIRL